MCWNCCRSHWRTFSCGLLWDTACCFIYSYTLFVHAYILSVIILGTLPVKCYNACYPLCSLYIQCIHLTALAQAHLLHVFCTFSSFHHVLTLLQVLMNLYQHRLQQDLFHELKKVITNTPLFFFFLIATPLCTTTEWFQSVVVLGT